MIETTFGNTPAAMYLARTLTDINNPVLSRSVGRRITATTNMVNELVNSYFHHGLNRGSSYEKNNGGLPAKTVANCLRLMREEIANKVEWDEMNHPADNRRAFALVEKLCKNVQIGAIKRGIRLCTVARKAEKVMTSPKKYGKPDPQGMKGDVVFTDSQSGKVFYAGAQFGDTTRINTFLMEEVSDVTPELLQERSLKRCTRLGKAHTKVTS